MNNKMVSVAIRENTGLGCAVGATLCANCGQSAL